MKKVLITFFLTGIFFLRVTAQNTIGVTQYEPDSVFQGYTLFAPLSDTITYLIDNCGREVHRWDGDFLPGNSVYLLENGDLLRTGQDPVNPNFNFGGKGGFVKLYDWDGTELWSFRYSNNMVRQHHDAEYLPNGNILLWAWERKNPPEAINAGRDTAFISPQGLWPEHIVEVNPSNDSIVWEWHLWDHLIQDFDSTKANYGIVSQTPQLIDLNATPSTHPDFVHGNGIDYNAQLDQIVISAHNYSEIWIIDHSTTTAEAASHSGGNSGMGGDILYRWGNPAMYDQGSGADQKLFDQHDASWIETGADSGKIMIFNNGVNRPCPPPCPGYSSVDIIDPPVDQAGQYDTTTMPFLPQDYAWRYVKPDSLGFYASFISGATRLPNENTLICDGPAGTLFEVNPQGSIVWEYVNPLANGTPLNQGDTAFGNTVFRAYRYGPEYPGLSGKTLTPGNYLELNPDSSHCDLYSSAVDVLSENRSVFTICPNPSAEMAYIEVNTGNNLDYGNIRIFDMTGKTIRGIKMSTSASRYRLPVNNIESGVYFVHLYNENDRLVQTGKWVVMKK